MIFEWAGLRWIVTGTAEYATRPRAACVAAYACVVCRSFEESFVTIEADSVGARVKLAACLACVGTLGLAIGAADENGTHGIPSVNPSSARDRLRLAEGRRR